jgi:hypothetical protein
MLSADASMKDCKANLKLKEMFTIIMNLFDDNFFSTGVLPEYYK